MKKKQNKKRAVVSEKNYLAIVDHNTKLIQENIALSEKLEAGTYIIKLKMYTDSEVKQWDFSEILKLIQFESPQLVVKILRTIHHNYSCLNLAEMATVLNRHTPTINNYSDQIPNELYFLKSIADAIESIKKID